jgi:hypothetical protein
MLASLATRNFRILRHGKTKDRAEIAKLLGGDSQKIHLTGMSLA